MNKFEFAKLLLVGVIGYHLGKSSMHVKCVEMYLNGLDDGIGVAQDNEIQADMEARMEALKRFTRED